MITLQDEDKIYFSKTREYFREVLSNYYNGNYRSAIVMLYSIAICDLLLKLQELKEIYNDKNATTILDDIDKLRNNNTGSKSSWEKKLVEKIHKETNLLDCQSFAQLNNLYTARNLSAHPAMNDNYELIIPSPETTIAHITNILRNILIKPPVFTSNVINMLTDDIAEKAQIFAGERAKFVNYLNKKYLDRMPLPMKENIFITFWKFCFRKPDNQNCMNNLTNNRLILEIIAEDNPQILEKIKTEEALKSISNNEYCVMNCCFFVSKFPKIYDFLSDEIKLCIDNLIEKYQKIKIFSWYKNTDKSNHIKRMIEEEIFDVDDFGIMQYVKESYSAEGLADVLCDYCIKAFSKSNSFNQADLRYTMHIKPNLDLFTKEQFIEILNIINSNAQIYNRGASYVSNTEIINAAKKILEKTFDYSRYDNIKFKNGTEEDLNLG